MAGHSKWANIQHRKGKQDKLRSKMFSKLAKEITVAAKMGIDQIWFGVLLGANMQTSFMHPPFGFALFYLRGIAPPSIKSSDIYLGAIPWLGLQLLLVLILIFHPEIVTGFLDKPATQDIQAIEIKLDESESGAQSKQTTPADDPADYFKRK